jgi:hypothetical protein
MIGEHHHIYKIESSEMISLQKKGKHIRDDFFNRLKAVTSSDMLLIKRKKETYQIWFAGLEKLPEENQEAWRYDKRQKCYVPNLKTKEGRALNKAITNEGSFIPLLPQWVKDKGIGVAEFDLLDDLMHQKYVEVLVDKDDTQFIIMIPKCSDLKNKPDEDNSIKAVESLGGTLISFGTYYDSYRTTINQYVC